MESSHATLPVVIVLSRIRGLRRALAEAVDGRAVVLKLVPDADTHLEAWRESEGKRSIEASRKGPPSGNVVMSNRSEESVAVAAGVTNTPEGGDLSLDKSLPAALARPLARALVTGERPLWGRPIRWLVADPDFLLAFPQVLRDTSAESSSEPDGDSPSSTSSSTRLDLQFVQSTWAGVDCLFTAAGEPLIPAPRLPLCRITGVFGQAMSEYVLGAVIATERKFLTLQRGKNEQSSWTRVLPDYGYRTLASLSLGVMGAGDIGSVIASRLEAMGARVVRVLRSTPRPAGNASASHREFGPSELETGFLPGLDYLINTLPHTPSTAGLLSGDVLRHAGRPVCFVNVGRGSVISESSLLHALDEQWLSSAWLDVFATEPLPLASPLWTDTRVFISPHVSAMSQPGAVAETFARNLSRSIAGDPLEENSLVDWEAGY
jgi:phosphoglycerate dehydrogenase-like enzyme